jgi:hypothetical protein
MTRSGLSLHRLLRIHIETFTRFQHAIHVRDCPIDHWSERDVQRLTEGGQFILDRYRHGRKRATGEKPVLLERAPALRRVRQIGTNMHDYVPLCAIFVPRNFPDASLTMPDLVEIAETN